MSPYYSADIGYRHTFGSQLAMKGESGSDRIRPFDIALPPEVARNVASIVAIPMEGPDNNPIDLIKDHIKRIY